MSQDKRQFQRDEIEEIVEVYVLPDSRQNGTKKVKSPPLYLKAKNISQEGICLETREFFIPNQILVLEFQVPREGKSHAYASVVWSEKNACGLRLIKPGELLDNLVRNEKS